MLVHSSRLWRQTHVSGSEVQQLFEAVSIDKASEINYNEVGTACALLPEDAQENSLRRQAYACGMHTHTYAEIHLERYSSGTFSVENVLRRVFVI